jgi:hypothetical protein
LRDAEDEPEFRTRQSRLSKWMEMTKDAAKANSVELDPVDPLEQLVSLLSLSLIFILFFWFYRLQIWILLMVFFDFITPWCKHFCS